MNRKNSPPPPFLRAALLLLLLSFSALVPRCEAAAVAAFAGAAPADEEDAQPSSLPFLRGGGGGGGGGSGGGDGGALGGWLEGPLRGIQKRYDGLSPRGRFIATAAAGFVASRLVMDVGATSLKVAGAAFIVTEVLHHAGLLDDLPGLSAEQRNFVQSVQSSLVKTAESFRSQVRRRLHPSAVQGWIDRDKMGALGLAAGSFAGIVL